MFVFINLRSDDSCCISWFSAAVNIIDIQLFSYEIHARISREILSKTELNIIVLNISLSFANTVISFAVKMFS